MRSLIWEWGQYFTVLCDQSVTTIVFDLNMRSLLYCTVLWDQSVIVLFDLDMRSVLYCTVLWDQSVTVLLCLVLPWGQRLTVLFWAHLQDLVYNPPSLLELSGRVVKVEKMRYSREDLPLNLVRYLDSAQRCVNPHCKGRSPTCPMQRFFLLPDVTLCQYPHLALSVCCSQMVSGCVCLCIAWNELVRGYAIVVYTLSSFRPPPPPTHTHTPILIPFEDRKQLGLKVDIADTVIDRMLKSRTNQKLS